jgi:hypothetical protein
MKLTATTSILVLAAAATAAAAPPARAGEPPAATAPATPAGALEAASAALQAGDFGQAASLAGPVARGTAAGAAGLARADRAEAWRLLALSLYFLGRADGAEAAFLEYLKLDVDAHLDPALVPPEALTFFEDVRTRHASELARYRPRPRRSLLPALLPPLGQFQNGDHLKGWIIGGAELALLTTNLTSYMLLRRWCDTEDQTCAGHVNDARTARTVNIVSGVALLGVVAYGIVDGVIGHRRQARSEMPPSLGFTQLVEGGAVMTLGGSF